MSFPRLVPTYITVSLLKHVVVRVRTVIPHGWCSVCTEATIRWQADLEHVSLNVCVIAPTVQMTHIYSMAITKVVMFPNGCRSCSARKSTKTLMNWTTALPTLTVLW